MRLLSIALRRFGPFTDRTLDFSDKPLALHVVFGPNEAGKSSSRRAVVDFLFGIPTRTPDAHLHAEANLEIGATLEGPEGRVALVRRKGRSSTLRDAASGDVVDESVLKKLLRGLERDVYVAHYALDHDSLRRGATLLLDGRAGLGESLFDASLGGAGVTLAMRKLTLESDNLFSPLARKKPLNEALRSYAETLKRAKDSALDWGAYRTQIDGIEEAREEARSAEEERRRIEIDLRDLAKREAMLPVYFQHRSVRAAREKLGEVVALPETATEIRERAEQDRREADLRLVELERELSRLSVERGPDPEPMSATHDDRVRELVRRSSQVEQLRKERGERGASVVIAEQKLAAIATSLRGARSEVREGFAARAKAAHLALTEARRVLHERETRDRLLEERRQRLISLEDPGSSRTADPVLDEEGLFWLTALVAQVEGLEEELISDEASLKLACAELGVPREGLAALAKAKVPPAGACIRVASEFEELRRKEAALATREREHAEAAASHALEARRFRKLEAVPTESDLARARATRDAALLRLFEAKNEDPARAKVDALMLVRSADDLADGLRRGMASTQELTLHRERTAELEREANELLVERREARTREKEVSEKYARMWDLPAGESPRDPLAMEKWLALRAEVLEKNGVLEIKRQKMASLEERLGSLNAPTSVGRRERLASLTRDVQEGAAERRRRESRDAELRDIESEREALKLDTTRAIEAEAAARTAWSELAMAYGAQSDATIDELLEIDAASHLKFEVERTRLRDSERIAAIDAELRAFENAVESLSLGSGAARTSDASLDVAVLAADLERRERDRERRLALRARMDEVASRLEEMRARRAFAQGRIDDLCKRAEVPESRLWEAEQRSRDARLLDAELTSLEAKLSAAWGKDMRAIEAALAETSADAIEQQHLELRERYDQAERRRDRSLQTVGRYEIALDKFGSEASASDGMTEAHAHLSRARALAERALVLRLSRAFLEREIEVFREKNQGPMLAHAERLFVRLTEERYERLRVVFTSEGAPELRCVRGREEVHVEHLSDGTKDQLYLALRLAALARHAEVVAPLPVLLDDVLVHFDDERAAIALEVLAEIGTRTQILLFTHHDRIREAASKLAGAVVHRV